MVPKNAEAGDARGMCLYAQMLENGLGVKKNEELAREWYGRAEAAGYTPRLFPTRFAVGRRPQWQGFLKDSA